MRFALLGVDDELLRIAAAASADGHSVVQACDLGKSGPALLRIAPNLQVVTHLESLLAGDVPDCVLVGRGLPTILPDENVSPADRRGEQLRRLVQEKIPIAVVPFACDLDQGYELEMYRRDLDGVVSTWFWDWNHAGYRWLENLLHEKDSTLGLIQKVRWDAYFPDRTREVVVERLVTDLAQLRRWLGPIDSVLATGATGETHYDPFAPKRALPPLDQLTVHLGLRGESPAVWSVSPGSAAVQARIMIVGTEGEAVLTVGPPRCEWQGELRIGGRTETLNFAAEPIAWIEFAQTGSSNTSPLPLWLDSCRDLEVIEALDRSLLKGRTVAVHADETSEEDAFKGVMASGGCIVLMLVLLAFFVVVLVEGLRLPLRESPLWKAWPVVLVVLIGGFLALQSLRGLTKRQTPGVSLAGTTKTPS